MSDPRENFQRYVNASVETLARDLVSLLNRANKLGIAVCPGVDYDEGTSYSIEWHFGGPRHLDVEYNVSAELWTLKDGSDV